MRCPFCRTDNDKVIDSRSSEAGAVIRRRRECQACRRRFTTYERVEEAIKLTVIKRDATREAYDRQKLIASLQQAIHKRPVSLEQLHHIAELTEEEIFRQFDKEVPSQFIAEEAGRRLRQVDLVAYVRFASVYRQFQDVNEFIEQAQQAVELARQDSPGQRELFNQNGAEEAIPHNARPPARNKT